MLPLPVPTSARPHSRNAAATRQAILSAAKLRFSTKPYELVGVRDIAADAGVDAALVNRYFGSKEKLFAAVVDDVFCSGDMESIGRDTLAEEFAKFAAFEAPRRRAAGNDPLLLMMLSATNPVAKAILRSHLQERVLRPLADKLGGRSACLRAAMVVSFLSGVRLMHEVLHTDAVDKCCKQELAELLMAAMRTSIDPPETRSPSGGSQRRTPRKPTRPSSTRSKT